MKRIWAKICHEIQGAKDKEREVIGLSVVSQGLGGMKSKKSREELSRSFMVYKCEDFTWVFCLVHSYFTLCLLIVLDN